MNKYHERFLQSFACENIVALFSRYRGGPKEVTESWAMLEAAKKYVPDLNERIVIVVGDGCSPRTGALFAYFTAADVISVDPNFNLAHWGEHCEKQAAMGFPVRRMRLIAGKIEDHEIDCGGKACVVVWPHSHAPMNAARIINYTARTDISMPCCVAIPSAWMERPHIIYSDRHVASPKRQVHVWGDGA